MNFDVDIEKYWNLLVDNVVFYGPKLLVALLALWLGFKLINRLVRLTRKGLGNIGFSDTLLSFTQSILSVLLKGLLLIILAGYLGFDLTVFVTVLATAGLAIGLALQGSLSNFAAGIIILIFKPYRIGDWIEVDGKFGKVEEIQIFNTLIVTPGQKTLIIPNGSVIEGIVTNFSKKGMIRLELNVTMPYEESFPRVKGIIQEALMEVDKVIRDPAPEIGIENYDSHSVLLAVRPYVAPDDYWEVTFATYEAIKKAFNQNNIKVAYSEGVEIGAIGE
ncbi:MAG TPA: mechanosensitive ion channel family protein [Saprospiraceae bacterium]|nr:mechanosensitive ion channel family protein [Saprospiraceae bacterium]